MGDFEVEILVAGEIAEQLENARRDASWGFDEAVKYRCGVVRRSCEDLIGRLDEKLGKLNNDALQSNALQSKSVRFKRGVSGLPWMK